MGRGGLSQLFLLRDSGRFWLWALKNQHPGRSAVTSPGSAFRGCIQSARVHGVAAAGAARAYYAALWPVHMLRESVDRERMQSDDAVWPYVQRSQKCPPRCPVSIPRGNGPAVLRACAAVQPASLTRCTEQPDFHTARIRHEHPPCSWQSAPISDEPSVVTCPGAAYQRSPPYHACVCV